MSLLTDLNEILDQKRPGYTAILAPGLGVQEISAIITESGLGFDLPEQAKTWFGWKNGIDQDAFQNSTEDIDSNIEAFQYPLSLRESIDLYLADQKNGIYPEYFFPILTNGGGNTYLVNTESGSPDYQSVFGFSKDRFNTLKAFTSVDTMVMTITESYRRNVLFISKEGELEIDIFSLQALYMELNPGCEYWAAE